MTDLSAVPAGPDVARHIAALIDSEHHIWSGGDFSIRADSNGDLIHVTTTNLDSGRKDAWVLTVEWDGER